MQVNDSRFNMWGKDKDDKVAVFWVALKADSDRAHFVIWGMSPHFPGIVVPSQLH